MDNKDLRQMLLSLYGHANAFRLIDPLTLDLSDARCVLKGAKETGKIIADGLLELIKQTPKQTPKAKHMSTDQFDLLVRLVKEYNHRQDCIYCLFKGTYYAQGILEQITRIYAAAAANIWV